MVHSLGLTLYNLRPRRDAAALEEPKERPAGPLVWMHAPSEESSKGLKELGRRLVEEDGVSVLLTCPDAIVGHNGLIVQRPPNDAPTDVRQFLRHWQPEVAIFSDGELRPTALHEAEEAGIPLILVDGRVPYLLRDREGWYPGLVRAALQSFDHVFVQDETAARAFRKSGAALSRVAVTGRLEEDSAALPCLEAERTAFARLLATRPVWLAAGVPEAEEGAVISAHRSALGLAHRLLLIIAPEDPGQAERLSLRLEEEEGWIVSRRSADEEPEPDVEVFVADGMSELGLWYRLAPITFLGGSLFGQGCVRNPMEAAALGSAILYGPRPGKFGNVFGRLGAAGGARAVGSALDLGSALSDLQSPDRAAKLAQSAWSVVSDGAETTENALALIRKLMDGKPA